MGREGGVVSAAVLRMEHQSNVKHLRLQLRVGAGRTQHQQQILRHGKALLGISDKQRLILSEMAVRVIGIYRDQRQLGDQLQTLAQHISDRDIIRFGIVGIQRQNAALHGIHDVLVGSLHNHVPDKTAAQGPQLSHQIHKNRKLLLIGKPAKEQQIDRLFKAESPVLLSLDHIHHIYALVIELSLCRDPAPVFQDETAHVRNFRQSCQHALSRRVPQPSLDVVLHIEVRINAVVLHHFFFQTKHILLERLHILQVQHLIFHNVSSLRQAL